MATSGDGTKRPTPVRLTVPLAPRFTPLPWAPPANPQISFGPPTVGPFGRKAEYGDLPWINPLLSKAPPPVTIEDLMRELVAARNNRGFRPS